MRKILSATVAMAAVVATAAPPGAATASPVNEVKWGPCPTDVTAPGLECSTVLVPLDYRNPKGQRIEIAISRLASTNPAKRRGILFTNGGGPGGKSLDFPNSMVESGVPQSVRDVYDVIGIDPRGVGKSTPVTCDMTPEQASRGNNPPWARNSADVVKRAEEVKVVARQCAESETAPLLPFITTANAARDMDLIRQMLGEKTASFLGYSYGTYLGAVYTTLFPRTTDRVVIDSSLPPKGLDHTAGRLMGLGFETRFPDFAEFVVAHPEYGLGKTLAEVEAKYFELAGRLDEEPVQGLDGAMFRVGTFGLLYKDLSFPLLAEMWKSVDTNQPEPPRPPPPPFDDNVFAGYLYVACGDNYWSRSVASYQRDVALDRLRFPKFGAAAAGIRACAFWPERVEQPVRVGDRGPSNVLIAQNLKDPATPLAGAKMMRQALGDRARMVTADQGNHGAYLFSKNKCLNDTVTTFLTTGQRPAADRACVAEHP